MAGLSAPNPYRSTVFNKFHIVFHDPVSPC